MLKINPTSQTSQKTNIQLCWKRQEVLDPHAFIKIQASKGKKIGLQGTVDKHRTKGRIAEAMFIRDLQPTLNKKIVYKNAYGNHFSRKYCCQDKQDQNKICPSPLLKSRSSVIREKKTRQNDPFWQILAITLSHRNFSVSWSI